MQRARCGLDDRLQERKTHIHFLFSFGVQPVNINLNLLASARETPSHPDSLELQMR